eukprot:3358128-Pleurochrysis_carterae.AAC.2
MLKAEHMLRSVRCDPAHVARRSTQAQTHCGQTKTCSKKSTGGRLTSFANARLRTQGAYGQ